VGFTLAFALQLRKKHGKTSVRVVIHKYIIRIHSHNNKNTLSNRNKTMYTLTKKIEPKGSLVSEVMDFVEYVFVGTRT
jgi:hypothetical protein